MVEEIRWGRVAFYFILVWKVVDVFYRFVVFEEDGRDVRSFVGSFEDGYCFGNGILVVRDYWMFSGVMCWVGVKEVELYLVFVI